MIMWYTVGFIDGDTFDYLEYTASDDRAALVNSFGSGETGYIWLYQYEFTLAII